MFISKRTNGIYHLYYEKPDGKIASKTTKTRYKTEAMKFFASFEAKQKQTNQIAPIKLMEFAQGFLWENELTKTEKTIKCYKTTFKHLEKYFGNIPLSEINPARMQEYFNQRLKDHSIFQARKDRINLGYAFNWAAQKKYLLENPCKEIKRFKIPEKQPIYFSRAEYAVLLNNIDDQTIKDLAVLAVNTGLRQMELLTLTWKQINFADRFLILDNNEHVTKSKKVRIVPLNNSAFEVLTERHAHSAGELIFTINGKAIQQDYISRTFKKYILKAHLNKKLNFHSLRHTFASWLVQKGVPIYEVSKLLGHADIKTTEIYSHLQPGDLRGATARLDNDESAQN